MLCIQIVALSAVAVVPVCADAARVVPMCNMFMLCIQMLCVFQICASILRSQSLKFKGDNNKTSNK